MGQKSFRRSASDTGLWWRLFASAGPVDVFLVDLSANVGREATAWEWLTEGERRRWRRFHYSRPRREFALCRGALRAVLCHALGCENRDLDFDSAQFGKPYARVGGSRVSTHFNISHSGAYGAIALSRQKRVGVDVEERRPRPNLPGLVESVFGPDEQRVLSTMAGERWLETFLRFWTIKEALAKAWGTGLHTDFSGFQAPPEIRSGSRTGVFRGPGLSDAIWLVEDLGAGELAAAVAYEK